MDLRPLTSENPLPQASEQIYYATGDGEQNFFIFFSSSTDVKTIPWRQEQTKRAAAAAAALPFACVYNVCVLYPAGYRAASVIIALTDGELRENQFDMAQREVRKCVGGGRGGGDFLSTAALFMDGCFSRRAEHASWAPPFTAWA